MRKKKSGDRPAGRSNIREAGRSFAADNPENCKCDCRTAATDLTTGIRSIERAAKRASDFTNRHSFMPQEMEWLTDNKYIAQREGRYGQNALHGIRRLPGCRKGRKCIPLIYLACQNYIETTGCHVTQDTLVDFFESCQSVRPLRENEIYSIPAMLKVCIIRYIASAAVQIEEIIDRYASTDSQYNPFLAELEVLSNNRKGLLSEESDYDLAAIAEKRHQKLSGDLADAFTSLRLLAAMEINDIYCRISHVERTLCRDPAGVYSEMEEHSRSYYRSIISKRARKHGITENEAAEHALQSAIEHDRHIGFDLLYDDRSINRRSLLGALYIYGIVLTSFLLCALLSVFVANPAYFFILMLPIWECVKHFCDYLAIQFCPPSHIPRMELKNGIPENCRTLCTVSALLTSPSQARRIACVLEEYCYANRDCGENLEFAILADLRDSKTEHKSDDEAILQAAAAEIRRLNDKFGGRFHFLYRERTKNRDGIYMGWERKRGAITELVRYLKAVRSGICQAEGRDLSGIRYLIALDADTRLTPGSAKSLIGCMAHPVNKPCIDHGRGAVISGYGIVLPRISVELESAGRTLFSRIFAGQGGCDPYGSTMSDVYQDLYGDAIFTGKGAIDIEAYFACLDNMPENRILSHDLLEGGYIRAGFAGDIELTDHFPSRISSYFTRAHRWIRGDFQVLPWLFGRVPAGGGSRVRNPINNLCKYKIFDNLRRALTPAALFACLLPAAFSGEFSYAVLFFIACAALAAPLLITAAQTFASRSKGYSYRYHSTIIAGITGALLHFVMRIIMLPSEAIIGVSAALTSLWRMAVSKKRMLEWVTAADADMASGKNIKSYYRMFWFSAAVGTAIVAASGSGIAYLFGVLWIIAPLLLWYFSCEIRKVRELSAPSRENLMRHAREIWRFFNDNLCETDHYLPPDNIQIHPSVGTAHRTSPTNIGLAVLCVLAAESFHFIDTERMLFLLENMHCTIKKLQKWNGHLLNWYDTTTLKPLKPVTVSTVDNGNMAGALIAAAGWLRSMNTERADRLADEYDRLVSDADFSLLYDSKRRFFYIGRELESDRFMEGWYDLLASEARQTSYIAIALGQVEKKHWGRLGRVMSSLDGYAGMVSWTGTMFEYAMPNLIMPCYENSLIYESNQYAVYCQRRRTHGRNIPWGISESAFYSFDYALNYQYKAHGVQVLGLKRGLDRETVVSPYSTFLALPYSLSAAVKNIQRLQKYDCTGIYGMYEAIDFTHGRLRPGREYEIVRCYMAHHLGMSLLSVFNLLYENKIQQYFMQNRMMAAFSDLLKEKVPVNAVTVNDRIRDIPEKPARISKNRYRVLSDCTAPLAPECVPISNGVYTLAAADSGLCRATCFGNRIYRFSGTVFEPASGIQMYLYQNGRVFSLTQYPDYDGQNRYSTELSGANAIFHCRSEGIQTSVTASVHECENAEIRDVEIVSQQDVSAELRLYFEPVLAPSEDHYAHEAFSKLFITSEIKGETLIFRRKSRVGKEERCLALCCDREVRYESSREYVLGREGYGRLSGGTLPYRGTQGTVIDPCAYASVALELKAGQTSRVRFSLVYARTREEALSVSVRVVRAPAPQEDSRLDDIAHSLGIDMPDVTQAISLMRYLLFDLIPDEQRRAMCGENTQGLPCLWQYGLSGDEPIVAIEVENENDGEQAVKLIRGHRLLSESGMTFDLAVLLDERGDYRRSLRSVINECLRSCSAEKCIGVRGGIHILDVSAIQPEDITTIKAFAALCYGKTDTRSVTSFKPRARSHRLSPEPSAADTALIAPDLSPPLVWSMPIANKRFGSIAADDGSGHIWYENSRQNKITPWKNDPLGASENEVLRVYTSKGMTSVFKRGGNACAVDFTEGCAFYSQACENLRISAAVFVPPDEPVRIIILECETTEESVEAEWMLPLVLSESGRFRMMIKTAYDGETGQLFAVHPVNLDFPGYSFSAFATRAPERYTCDRLRFLEGEYDEKTGSGLEPCLAQKYTLPVRNGRARIVLVCGCAQDEQERRALRAFADDDHARAMLERTKDEARGLSGIRIRTPVPELDAYINRFAMQQIYRCRIEARTSVYQNGGAFGFRDQLQDSCAMLYSKPEVTHAQILLAAAHQYEEGDVCHWWHRHGVEPHISERGVRTRCSDDLLWLVYTVCEYVKLTGDSSVLDKDVPYLVSPPLGENEHDRYEVLTHSAINDSVAGHCIRAMDCFIGRGTGSHGLALMLDGDWNDGMNKVGEAGRGESVWLSWFASYVMYEFINICSIHQDERYRGFASELAKNASKTHDGGWFLRGYYDNGAPLGSASNSECRIDSIAQSFSCLAKGVDEVKKQMAVQNALDILFDRENGIVRLFAPSFEKDPNDPGYIMRYPPGVRENGGQYTHAAVWLAMACFLLHKNNDGMAVLRALLPATHPMEIYKAEPYVLAADVYYNRDNLGRGGWSWYTGAAGWYFRVVIGHLLGMVKRGNTLYFSPNLPDTWNDYLLEYRYGNTEYRFHVYRSVDAPDSPQTFRLTDDGGAHDFEVPVPPA